MEDPQGLDDILKTKDIAELFRLTGLIYLNRAGRGASLPNQMLRGWIEESFAILERVGTCERTFPLFIVACEAQTDDRRSLILGILNSTQAQFQPGSIMSARGCIERFWAQDDLDVERIAGYASKVTAALNSVGGLAGFS